MASLTVSTVARVATWILWGAAGLVYLFAFRTFRMQVRLAWIFGSFYVALGLLALVVFHPFGLRLELPENVFHLTIGPLMLILAAFARHSPDLPVWPAAWHGLKPN